MHEELRIREKRVVGTKQVLRAIDDGSAKMVFLGKDADGFIFHRINGLCEAKSIPLTLVDTMEELGNLCMVKVPTAAVALLN